MVVLLHFIHGHPRSIKQGVHLFECASLGLGEEEYVAESGDEIQYEEEVEVIESNLTQRDRATLRKK